MFVNQIVQFENLTLSMNMMIVFIFVLSHRCIVY